MAAAVGTLTPPEPTGIPNPAAYSRDTDPMTQVSRPPRTGWWRLLLAAAVAVLVGLLSAGTASATTLPEVETRVGASTPVAAYVVGVHESITAGQRWGHAPPTAQIASATGVAANSVRLGATYERLYEGGGGVLAQVDEAGILNLAIERGVATPSGGAMFNEAMSAVGPVNGIRGTWTTSMPSNLDAFNANIRAGMSVQDAARSTFTGTMAGRSGFTTVSVEQLTGSPGAYTNVKVVFGR